MISDGDDEGPPVTPAARAWSAPTVELGNDRAHVPATTAPPSTRGPFDLGESRFEPRGELGRGGMGRVDQAFDRALGRAVAIKRLLRASDVGLVRFAREARLTAQLEHPGVVPIHDVGYGPDGTPFYVMRRVDGRPLAELSDGITLAARLALIPNVLAACDAVAFAHARGIVHRDLKPQNILVGRFGETLVIDWGLARELQHAASASGDGLPIADDGLTAAGAAAGTPGFMAPEQARGDAVDARADVFALGATLFYVLSGQLLYDGASATEMVSLASAAKPPNWSALPAGVPADLRAIVVKAIAGDPAGRYVDAGALAADLRQFVAGNLVGAHVYGLLARSIRFVRRHRATVAIAATAVIALAVVGIVSVRRIVAERDAASAARALAETRQREATDAADDMLIAHAQELATTDPVAAITLLRRLDATSSRWREAWLAAVAAWTRGIPFGFRGEHPITWVQIAADNRHAVTTSMGGAVTAYDLVARTQRVVARLPGATTCQWIGEHEVLCRDDKRLTIVDTLRATTKALDIKARVVISDRRSRGVVETRDHQILAIDGATGTSRVLATDAVLGGASLDLDEIALWHGGELDLWTPSRVLTVERFANAKAESQSSAIEIRDHAIVAIVGDQMIRWHVQGDLIGEDRRWPRQQAIAIGLVGSQVYSLTPEELDIDGVAMRGLKPSSLYSTARGAAVIETDGGIVMLDDDRRLRLGPFPARIERTDLSPDGRFLIAISADDEVLVWDLDRLRPHSVLVETREVPIMLAPPYVWTRDFARGIVRHELGSDQTSVSLDARDSRGWLGLADDARWIAVRAPDSSQIQIYDVEQDRSGRIYKAVAQAGDVDGIVFAHADGSLRKWRAGAGNPDDLGRLPAAPLGISVGGTFVVALLAGGTLTRLEPATGVHSESKFGDDVQNILVARSGVAWIQATNGALWRWSLGASPVRVALADPVEDLEQANGRILARTSRSLFDVEVEPMHAVAIDAKTIQPLSAGYVATLSAHGEVSVLDLETGARLVLPATATTEALVTRGDTLMVATARSANSKDRYDVIDLAVPHDPAALQRWLANVTNAVPGGGWPSP